MTPVDVDLTTHLMANWRGRLIARCGASLLAVGLAVQPGAGQEAASEAGAEQGLVRVSSRVEGLEGDLERNVRAVVELSTLDGEPVAPERARTLFRRAPRQIRAALEPFGRYEVSIDAQLAEEGEEWAATFRVDPGPPTIVSAVELRITGEGARDSTLVALADEFPLAVGDTLLHAPYEATKAALMRYARDKGYFDARIDTAELLVDRERRSAEVRLFFSTGTRHRFGPITFGQNVLEPSYLRGYSAAVEGQPFDVDDLRESQVALTSGPWFERADVHVRHEEAEGLTVPVSFELTPEPSQHYEVAGGYGTDTGVRGTLAAELRRLTRRGHNADFEVRVSQVETSVGGRYNIPRPFPSTHVYSGFGSLGDVSPDWSSTLVGTVGVSLAHSLGPLREVLSVIEERSSYDVAGREGHAWLVVAQADWSWVEANDRILATRGHRLHLNVSGAHDALLSTTSFVKVHLEAKLIRSLSARSRIIARAEGGRIGTGDLSELPPTRRFVTGGDETVRGFGFQSVGPEDRKGRLLGGSALLVGSLETDFEVRSGWRVAAFGDAGDAMMKFRELDLEYAVGGGIRWESPLGLIRVDGAFPLSDPDRSFRVHFMIGPDL